MVSVVTSTTCNATSDGVPVTQLPTTGFSLTSVNLIGTANVSGNETAVLIENIDITALTSINDIDGRLSAVSVAAATNTSVTDLLRKVPVVGFFPSSVGAGELVGRIQFLETIVTQTGAGAASGVVSTSPVSVPVTVRFLAGDTSSTSEFGTMVFNTSTNTATVNFSTSTTVASGDFIEVRGSGTIADLIKDFSWTLRVRRTL